MVDLLILALLAACIVLWRELAKLRARVDLLEGGSEIFRYDVDRSDYEPSRAQAVSARAPAVVVEEAPPPPPPVEPEPSVEREPSVEPAPPPEPVASEPIQSSIDDDDVDEPEPKPRLGFEELFGRRLPIWAGGVTLAVAGFLIVKYSIDSGLLSPVVRMIMGLMFGTALIAAAEAALRGEGFVRDPRVRQALSGAGIATFYATILVAANIYHLIGPGTAFLAMALVTAAALGLSLRFGAPSAILGLVGGLAAPALVGAGEPNVPLLSSYLALTVGGLTAVSRQQRWAWLGAGALVGGFGWGIILLLGGAMDATSTISLGILIVLLGIAFPLILLADRGAVLRLVAGGRLLFVERQNLAGRRRQRRRRGRLGDRDVRLVQAQGHRRGRRPINYRKRGDLEFGNVGPQLGPASFGQFLRLTPRRRNNGKGRTRLRPFSRSGLTILP